MAATSHRLRTDRALRDDQLAHDAFLESNLTHVRILTEFFMGRLRKDGTRSWKPKTDLVPHDILPSWTPPATSAGQQLDEALPKIDAFLSHLSKQRLDIKAGWGFTGLTNSVLSVAGDFDRALSAAGAAHAEPFHTWWFLAARVLVEGPIRGHDS